MDAQRNKVTAKLTSSEPGAPPPTPRAKISGTARARTRTAPAPTPPPPPPPAHASLRPIAPAAASARRSPSPAKMRAPPFTAERTRHGSVSSLRSLPSGSAPPTPVANGHAPDAPASMRVKAKVSGLAKAKAAAPSLSTLLSPPSPRARAPTITTTFHQRSMSHSHVDSTPQIVPLPTSPPASTLSSLSSASASSQSQPMTDSLYTPAFPAAAASSASLPIPPPPHRQIVARVRPGTRISGGRSSSVSGSMSLSATSVTDDAHDDDTEDDDDDAPPPPPTPAPEDRAATKARAAAKSNRKIADLEITTRSLLAINAALEAAKVRQARELRELRRRLRETRLVLPPRAFRQLRAADDDTPPEEPDEESSEDDDADADDAAFARLRGLVEGMLDAGRRALAAPCSAAGRDDEAGPVGRPEVLGWEGGGKHGVAIGSRVLSPEEAGLWVEGAGRERGGEGEARARDAEGSDGEGRGGEGSDGEERARDDTPVGFARDEPPNTQE